MELLLNKLTIVMVLIKIYKLEVVVEPVDLWTGSEGRYM